MDYLPAERNRGITIQSAAITFPWRDYQMNLIDTPGHADFTFEVERSLRVLDGAVVILDAVAGVEAQTEKVWKQADRRSLPRIIFVNKMDRTGANFGKTVVEVAATLQCRPLVLQIPIFASDDRFHRCLACSRGFGGISFPNWTRDVVNAYLDTEDAAKIPAALIKSSIRKACLKGSVIPVLLGASFRNIAVQPLLDAVTNLSSITTGCLDYSCSSERSATRDCCSKIQLPWPSRSIDIPPPVFTVTLETSTPTELKALDVALDNLLREDPSLRLSYDEESGQTLLSGNG
ncbi:hypothetical protein MRB53_039331 [Persea americana]|nr:hypothetical protein MRB53_039331 [Persea americana]